MIDKMWSKEQIVRHVLSNVAVAIQRENAATVLAGHAAIDFSRRGRAESDDDEGATDEDEAEEDDNQVSDDEEEAEGEDQEEDREEEEEDDEEKQDEE
jgi:hypothetical protein